MVQFPTLGRIALVRWKTDRVVRPLNFTEITAGVTVQLPSQAGNPITTVTVLETKYGPSTDCLTATKYVS